jgi:hypothetical protein
MRSANTVDMAGDLDRIVALAADIERWPVILPHYRWVTLLAGGGDHKTVEMAARRGRIPVKWRAIQEIERDDNPPIIWFTHIGGVTKGMEVAVAERIIGPHFVEAIAGKTLATIKAIVEDRDPRFDPDGRRRS